MPCTQYSFYFGFDATEIAARQTLIATIARLSDIGLSKSRCEDIEIALGEAVNNVVEHACAGMPGARARLTCRFRGDVLLVEIRDTGRPMPENCLPSGAQVDLSGPIEDLPEGGFGWFLIRQIATNIGYTRKGRHNCLTLEFPAGA